MSLPLQIIMIDNFDSFTYNLVNQFRMLDAEVVVFRNDTPIESIFTESRLADKQTIIVISPGPGNPDSAGISLQVIKAYAGQLPILGICLGHQSIVQQYGGKIGQAKSIVHGKADQIIYDDTDHLAATIFEHLPKYFQAARYHSLVAEVTPDDLAVIATTSDREKEVMAVADREKKVLGFQFHPESILTTQGSHLLQSSIQWLLSDETTTK
ncbi:aminodeoxychorismate/anthranilate synthase component II [Aliikangiella marina]|uniref:anthranilate synthase n=1 Tax=Aliikangiella marina TaxID=1712262 RepID=A0A545TEB9_9GAMM|nr:aminodeoxychorismate/anthranilate synthase component II [Aliikangiella marina]TQV75572.1 aminodeoxychorismate/anthranilate synthase component II [Aliikangiella marina]